MRFVPHIRFTNISGTCHTRVTRKKGIKKGTKKGIKKGIRSVWSEVRIAAKQDCAIELVFGNQSIMLARCSKSIRVKENETEQESRQRVKENETEKE